MDDFWDRITLCIKNSEMTQYQLAEGCGVPLATFNKWKKGRVYPRADIVYQWAEILGVSMEFLITGKDAEDPALEIVLKYPGIRDLVELLGQHPVYAPILKAYLEGKIDTHEGNWGHS